ncbi:MAG: formate dehydrogenase subunit gamma [Ramlibacter sp.]
MNQDPKERARAGHEAVLATPGELRSRIRQLGKASAPKDNPMLARVREIVAAKAHMDGALLPILHDVQDNFGYIASDAVAAIASGLNLSRAEVHGVVTYYHHFRSAPAGRHVLELCRAEACQALGAGALWQHACESFGLAPDGGTTPDGALTLEPVYCLGLCAQSPTAMLDGRVHARLNPQRLDALVACVVEAA